MHDTSITLTPHLTGNAKMHALPAKLHYFRGRGRSQQSRWALAAANIAFTSCCLSTSQEFAALQPKLTYGQVPMLEHGDLCISQSMAIVRHTARVGSLYGASVEDASRVDEVLDGIIDARGVIVSFPFMDDPREACMRLRQSMQRFWPSFEALIERNATPPHVVGSSLTVADVLLAELVHSATEAFSETFGPEISASMLEPYPRLRALHAHVVGLPQVQAFMAGPNWFPFPAGKIGVDYVRNVRDVLG